MNNFLITTGFILSLFSSFSQKETDQLLSDLLTTLPDKTQLSVAIIKNGQPEYHGIIKENDSIRFINNQTRLFEIGSITKVFTATILAHLITDGTVKPGATVNHYFRFRFNEKSSIRLTELASHTSGIPRLPSNLISERFAPGNPYKNYTAQDLENYLKNDLKLLSKPGTAYTYSNTGAGLLGTALGISQNSTYPVLLQTCIFDRYKMTQSFSSRKNMEDRLVRGMNESGEEVSNWDWDALAGAGCVIATVEDLVRFASAHFDPSDTALNLTRTPVFTISDTMAIGLGWHIITKPQTGKRYIWHNGGTGGYSSSMALDTENKNGVIILSNASLSGGELDQLCFELLEQTE